MALYVSLVQASADESGLNVMVNVRESGSSSADDVDVSAVPPEVVAKLLTWLPQPEEP